MLNREELKILFFNLLEYLIDILFFGGLLLAFCSLILWTAGSPWRTDILVAAGLFSTFTGYTLVKLTEGYWEDVER